MKRKRKQKEKFKHSKLEGAKVLSHLEHKTIHWRTNKTDFFKIRFATIHKKSVQTLTPQILMVVALATHRMRML